MTTNITPHDDRGQEERFFKFIEILKNLESFTSTSTSKDLIGQICKEADAFVSADYTHIRLINWSKNILEIMPWSAQGQDIPKYEQYLSIKANEAIGGYVFTEKTTRVSSNLQDEPEFKLFLQSKKQPVDSVDRGSAYPAFIVSLELAGPAIVVPLLLESKCIGVLSVVRAYNEINGKLPEPFTQNDTLYIERFANFAAIAIRNFNLLKAVSWRPDENVNPDTLCQSVVSKAQSETGANKGQVRFYNWNKAFLVPGTVQWTNSVELIICELCACENGHCTSCRVVQTKTPLLINSLKSDKDFQELLAAAGERDEFNMQLIEALTKCLVFAKTKSIQEIKEFCNQVLAEIQHISSGTLIIEKRFTLPSDTEKGKINDFFEKQIIFLKNLSQEWKIYLCDLQGMKSEIAVPILYGKLIIGVLAIQSDKENWFTESDVLFLQTLANRVASSIMEHQQNILKELLNISNQMTTCLRYDKVAEMLSNGAKQGIARLAATTKVYPLLYVCKEPKVPDDLLDTGNSDKFGQSFSFEPSISAASVDKDWGKTNVSNTGLGFEAINEYSERKLEDHVFTVRENVDDPISGGSDAARNRGIQTTACIPLTYNRLVYGLFYIHVNPRYFFTELEKDALVLFAKQAAIVLKNILILGEGQQYDEVFGEALIGNAAKHTPSDDEHSSSNLFERFSQILSNEKDKLISTPQLQAVQTVQSIVRKLVQVSNLPENIATRYIEFGKDESLLYFSDSYRDHFFHPFHTFLLGFVLLRKLKETKSSKKDGPENETWPFFCDNEELLLKKWLLTSLWHDICYAAEKGHAWLTGYIKKKLDFDIKVNQEWGRIFTNVQNISALQKIARKFATNAADDTVDAKREIVFYAWLSNQLEKHNDHGVLSAILLIREFEEKHWRNTKEQEIIECALSIALHNFPKAISGDMKDGKNEDTSNAIKTGTLDINNHPLAFLLSYCDTAQEWGRPSNRRKPDDVLLDYIKFVDVLIENSNIYIELSFDMKVMNSKEELEDEVWASHQNQWTEKTKALQTSWGKNTWKFYIRQSGINMDNPDRKDHSVCQIPKDK